MPGEFLDSNVLIYAFTSDARAARAQELLAGDGITSVQGLNEFANVARRKLAMSWAEINDALANLKILLREVLPMDLQTHEEALRIVEHHNVSFFDALMVASALRAQCTTLWSEDMQHGLLIHNRLGIVNPFARP